MKLEHLTDGAPQQWNEVGFRKAFISRVLRKGYVAVSGKKKKVVKCTFLCVLASHLRCNLTQMIQPLCALSFPVEKKNENTLKKRLSTSCDCVYKRISQGSPIYSATIVWVSTSCQKRSRYQEYNNEQNTILYSQSFQRQSKDKKHKRRLSIR